jgi:plastocyanin
MKKLKTARTAALATGMLFALPAMAEHHGSGHMNDSAPAAASSGYGGMPACSGKRYGPAPYAYPRPMYGPRYGMPYAKPLPPQMRGYMPGFAPRQPMYDRSMNRQQTYRQPMYGAQAGAPAAATVPAAPAPADAAAESAEVSISQMQFMPARVVVKKGAKVTWLQQDQMPHNVTASNGSFGSDTLTGGGSFTKTFDEAGTFSYYCGLHPSMRGEVVVVE